MRRNFTLPPYITAEGLRAMQQDRNEQLRKQPYDQDPRIPADAVDVPRWVVWLVTAGAVAMIGMAMYTSWGTWGK